MTSNELKHMCHEAAELGQTMFFGDGADATAKRAVEEAQSRIVKKPKIVQSKILLEPFVDQDGNYPSKGTIY